MVLRGAGVGVEYGGGAVVAFAANAQGVVADRQAVIRRHHLAVGEGVAGSDDLRVAGGAAIVIDGGLGNHGVFGTFKTHTRLVVVINAHPVDAPCEATYDDTRTGVFVNGAAGDPATQGA